MPGRTLKTSPVPSAGLFPIAKRAGKIKSPAMTAIRVSKKATESPEVTMLSFFER